MDRLWLCGYSGGKPRLLSARLQPIVGPAGRVVTEKSGVYTFHVKPGDLERTLQEGLVSRFDFGAVKTGFYRIKVGVRDPITRRIGSVTRFVEAPIVRTGK